MKTVDEQITEDENMTGVFFSTYERAFIRRIGEAVCRNAWQSATKAQMDNVIDRCQAYGIIDNQMACGIPLVLFPGDPT